MVNTPLVAELLAAVFQLEAIERERASERLHQDLSDETISQYKAFEAGKHWSPTRISPASYPFKRAVAEFESFGAFCMRHQADSRSSSRNQLLTLRNALCHGHYATWKAIESIALWNDH
jgi:hypothetical protein